MVYIRLFCFAQKYRVVVDELCASVDMRKQCDVLLAFIIVLYKEQIARCKIEYRCVPF